MARVTFIVGLCASGKSHLLGEMLKKSSSSYKDEGFIGEKFNENYEILKKSLQNEKDYIIVEIGFYLEQNRKIIIDKLKADVPGVEIIWKCFENDIEKANKNISNRKNKSDVKGHKDINSRISPIYTFPDNAEILSIVTIDS